MALATYRKKRKFEVTPEPRGHKARRGGHRYVIQKHAARRLHYDFRLELDGVMKSWAVTRGPSLDPNEKRLAVHVEDHPIEYNSFEGTIPKGEYGGGTVMIWDRGTWTPEGDPHRGYAKGHLVFDLNGEKLHGRWHLVRMRPRAHERHENWLLIKAQDAEARGPHDADILQEEPRSVVSDRSIEEIAAGKGGKNRVWHSNRADDVKADSIAAFKQKMSKLAAKPALRANADPKPRARGLRKRSGLARALNGDGAALPDFVPLSLAMFYDQPPSGPNWLHEIKFDGYRLEARLDHGRVQLLTRKQQDWTHRFKPVAEAVGTLPAATALLDGELVVEDDNGVSNFSLLQIDLKAGRTDRFIYYVFDLLHLDGRDLTDEPLVARKAVLARLLKGTNKSGVIRYTEHFDESGPLILRHACEMGLEGIVSKRRDAPYRGGRTDNLVKSKCHDRQEFVVAGYTPSTALPNAIGALIVAVYENGELRYAGRVGTGYTQKMAHNLFRRLAALRTARRPVELPPDERRKDVIWVEPKLVIEVEFAGITHGGVLRQGSFKGVREDKPAQDVVREVPAVKRPEPRRAAMAAQRRSAASGDGDRGGQDDNNGGVVLQLTHPDRVYWPDAGVTKTDLAAYYASVWEWIEPHLVGRPLALLRCPQGTSGHCFFQKHIPGNIKASPLRHVVAGKEHDVIAVQTLDDLIALVQSGALEIHARGSRLDDLEVCDRIVFDLDPGEGVPWRETVAAAREIRERLQAQKLESFVKLTGGKGVHVVAPIDGADWSTAKSFTQGIVSQMAADSPQRYVATMTKALRDGRIFIDYFRNSREATSVAPYSTRARPGAPVAAPVTWERLSRTAGGNDFSLLDLKKRLKRDAWADIGKVRQQLPEFARR